MLWYKAWLETRWRFLLCLGGLAFCSGFFVLVNGTGDNFHRLPTFAFGGREARALLFRAHVGLVALFPIAAILLGMGGVVREKAVGTSSFTLALPVSRTHLMLSRVGIGVLEIASLTFAPWILMLAVTYFYLRQPISLSFASPLLIALFAGGLLLYAMAVLISSVIEGEYTAPVVAFGIFVLDIYGTVIIQALRPLNIVVFMRLQEYVNRQNWTILSPLPWGGIAGVVCGMTLFFAASMVAVAVRDF